MKLFKPSRFRLRTMLLAIAFVAMFAYLAREWYLLRDARQQFDFAWQGWDAGRVVDENVVLTSRRLMKAEAMSPWISRRAAQKRHQERLNTLFVLVDAKFESPREDIERRLNVIRQEMEKYGVSPTVVEDP